MKLFVTCEFRFKQTPDQQVWTSNSFAHQFWQRYLTTFNQVTIVARVKQVSHAQPDWKKVTGEKVNIVALPHYVGLKGLLKNTLKIRRIIRKNITSNDALIFRVPSQTAMIAFTGLSKKQKYAIEVVGDPYDVFKTGITNSILDKFLGWISYKALQRIAKNAVAGCYVTESYLQQRYPVGKNALSMACSDVELTKQSFAAQARHFHSPANKLVFIGSFEQLYKGPDIAIGALALLLKQGYTFQLTLLGEGQYLEEIKQLSEQLGCANYCHFIGAVSKQSVEQYLSDADIFIMPSRTEGLPRALLEAMAKGLPCVASNVGGIPELLPFDDILEINSPEHLAEKLVRFSLSTDRLNSASKRNLAKAFDYQQHLLDAKRTSFYQGYKNKLKQITKTE